MNHIWLIEYEHSRKGWVPFEMHHTKKDATESRRIYQRNTVRRYRVRKWARKEEGE